MKYIIMGLLLATGIWAGCSEDTVIPVSGIPNGEKVTLTYSIDEVKMSRSAGETFENTVHTLDVFIFEDENGLLYHQHVEGLNASTGSITLDKAKDEFKENQEYQIHLIANSSRTDWSGITSVTALKQAEEKTAGLHLTQAGESGNSPTKFLMYGNGQVILNAGSVSATSPIAIIILSRAAAKIQVVLEEGFIKDDNGDDTDKLFQFSGNGVLFNFVNYQNTTRYVYDADAKVSATLINKTDPSSSAKHIKYGTTGDDAHRTITITTYAYANEWQNDQQNTMTHLVVQVPYTKEDGETVINNYYKIPVSKNNRLEPNHFYTVHATLNAVGSTQIDDPIELEDIQYSVLDWIEQPINIGGGEQPHYLSLNKEELEMKNIDEDNTIIFASSGRVSITKKRVYYYNKYGQETEVSQTISNRVIITPDENINGKITIDSPVPDNNLIRYIEFTVTNNDSECEPVTVTVKQYPQEYITYYFGWYSYREDFGCNYETISNANNNVTASWNYNNKWEFSSTPGYGYFSSKVVEDQPNNGYNNKQGYLIKYYYWSGGRFGERKTISAQNDGNPRMYHVQINSSAMPEFPKDSEFDKVYPDVTYQLGIPRKDAKGRTMSDEANNNLVSPSFMIASRLGFVNGELSSNQQTAYEQAASHCANYVEVYYPRDEMGHRLRDNQGKELPAVKLDDWRLPTKAELLIIMRYQGTSRQGTDAMDYLLNAKEYMSASGFVTNPHSTASGNAIRCVRDHYENKEQQ